MDKRHIFLTSNGLTEEMKQKFFEVVKKNPQEIKILFIPTAGIETDGARESFAIGLYELLSMGIRYENILVYNLELLLSKGYERTYSAYFHEVPVPAKVLNAEELLHFDAVLVGGGDSTVLCREMVRTGFDESLKQAIEQGLVYVGISAGSMYAAGNLHDGLHLIDHPVIPHWDGENLTDLPQGNGDILLADGQIISIDENGVRLL